MLIRMRIFLHAAPSFVPLPRPTAVGLVFLPVFLLFSVILFVVAEPVLAAAESDSPVKQVVPQRTIQLKDDKDVAWKTLWDQGRELARSGRLAEAAPVYETLLGMREGLETARWELVTILLQLKREERALPLLESLVEAAPENFQYLLALAETSRNMGNGARAVELYKKILLKEPGNLQALRGGASALLVQEKKAEAAVMLETLLKKDPSRTALHEELGNLYYDLAAYEKARAHFAVVIRENRADQAILLKMAQTCEKLGMESQAIDYWQRLARVSTSPEAKERLTAYYLKGGKPEDALAHLLPLFEKDNTSPVLLKRLGRIYVSLARPAEALAFFERYISFKPEDKEVLRQVIEIRSALADKPAQIIPPRGLAFDPGLNLDILERGAGQYEADGEFREAVALYDQILRAHPDNLWILAKRARALLAGGNNAEAEVMWANLDRRQKLLEVLEAMFVMEPGNRTVLEKLARIYLDRRESAKALEMFSRLETLEVRTPEVLAGQAGVYAEFGHLAKALNLYEQLMDGAYETGEFRLRALELSGTLGLSVKTRTHLTRLREKFPELHDSPPTRLLIAKALTETGSYGAAREYYAGMLTKNQDNRELVTAALLGLAEVHRLSGLPYEAEQALRQAYLKYPQNEAVLERLFAMALEQKRFDEAGIWLAQLTGQESSLSQKNEKAAKGSPDSRLLRARLLAADDETKAAVKILRQLAGELPEPTGRGMEPRLEVDLLLARLLFNDGQYAEAERIAGAWAEQRGSTGANLILLRLYRAQGKAEAEKALLKRMLAESSKDQSLVLDFLRALKEEGHFAELGARAELAARQYPESVVFRSLLAAAQEANGQIGEAIEIQQGIVRDFPEQEFAAARLAHLLFSRGRFAEAHSIIERFPAISTRPDMILLKARILWAEHEWQKSLAAYHDFLKPSVAETLAEQGRALNLALPEEKSADLWSRLTVTASERPTLVDGLMSLDALLDSQPEAAARNNLAVSLYSRYRWHKRFTLEETARQSVMRLEYLAAANYFKALLREYPADASLLFDLAGIYSRFGQLGHEAALYEEIKAIGGDLPGLAEARRRNDLKRQPRAGLGYGYLREEGRGGYKAIRKSWEEASLQYSPYLQHDLEVNLARLDYQNPDGNSKVRGTRALVSYAANINEHLLLRGGGGAEMLGNSRPDTTVLAMAAEGRLGDRLTGILSYGRDVVHDTLASLGRNIIQQDYKASFMLDMVPSVQAGGGYLHASFSDDNAMRGYDLWAAYLLFFEPAFLKFSYTYDFKDTDEARVIGVVQPDGFAASDHPYWTPLNYWRNRFSVYFKHQLSGDQFRRGVPRYYDLEYAVIYDEKGYAMQTWKGGFFVEYAPQIIFSAKAELTSGPEYRNKEFFLSAVYRW